MNAPNCGEVTFQQQRDYLRPIQDSTVRGAFLTAIIVILLLATGVRFHKLGAQSLWNDEGNSYVQATRSFAAIADHASRDIHPPGYYWLLALWMKLAGETEFALRALSAFASVLSVAFTYALGARIFGRLAGLTAALFVALNTFSIYYAQETRMYALLALWAGVSMWLFVEFIRCPNTRWAIAIGVINAAGLYTQYAFPFVILAQGALFAFWIGADVWNSTTGIRVGRERQYSIPRSTRACILYFAVANTLTVLLFSPWISTAWQQISTWPNTGHPIDSMDAITRIIADFAYGITAASGTTVMVVYFLAFGLLVLPQSREREWWRTMVPTSWVIMTVGVFLVLGLFRDANLKLLLPAQIAFALWMGRGVSILSHIQPRRSDLYVLRVVPKTAAVLGSFALVAGMWDGLHVLYDDPNYQRDDYRAIVTTIQTDLRSGDAIVLAAPNQQEVFRYYFSDNTPVYALPPGLGGDDTATLSQTRQVIEDHDRVFAVFWGLEERDPNNIVENTLDSEAFEIDDTWYGDVRLVRYVTPVDFDGFVESGIRFGEMVTLERYALSAETVNPGTVIQLKLVWSADSLLDLRYKVFVQLLDADNILIAQRDAEPGGGRSPTTTWQSGESIVDNHALVIPKDLHPANYRLIIGLYNSNDPEDRLLVMDSDEVSDYITLEMVVVTD